MQRSPTPNNASFSTVAPDVIQSLGTDPVTGDPIYLWESAVSPNQTQEFLRLLITQ
jgi:hypothetical protein